MPGASSLANLMTVMQKMRDMQGQPDPDTAYALGDDYLNKNVYPILQSQAQLKTSLQDLAQYLEQNKNNRGVTMTGPVAGDYWRVTPQYSAQDSVGGGALPHPWVSSILNSMMPEQAEKRAGFESRIQRLGESGFAKGGKTLSGTELGITIGPLPSTRTSYDVNKSMINENLNNFIPQNIKTLKDSILSRGVKPEVADNIINQFMQDHGIGQ